jgi:hypothetical protein
MNAYQILTRTSPWIGTSALKDNIKMHPTETVKMGYGFERFRIEPNYGPLLVTKL